MSIFEDIAQEWREVVAEMEANVPSTEGMSWGEVIDATAVFVAEPEQVERVADYVALCARLGCQATPEGLESMDRNENIERQIALAEAYYA
jgi:hypothetical protein